MNIPILTIIMMLFTYSCVGSNIKKIEVEKVNNVTNLPHDYKSLVDKKHRVGDVEQSRFIPLAGTKFTATVGLSKFVGNTTNQYDCCILQIQFPINNKITHILYSRVIPISMIGNINNRIKINDIVTYDNKTRKVVFKLNNKTFSYVIPKHLDKKFEGDYGVDEPPPPPE